MVENLSKKTPLLILEEGWREATGWFCIPICYCSSCLYDDKLTAPSASRPPRLKKAGSFFSRVRIGFHQHESVEITKKLYLLS